ncbi:uncharacterized protein LAESUDRAFT_725549 [Laetiporus sulphureus 93-53]|uniref:Trypsin-like serine protease n=1 Tax=Laetiporus sulphureus 93-53 TaxID=1314785 RepID=A0A165EDB0_9APHY|nr:uncharacterized protein LAESUDRAFT_725549 [Laetiporus sulphureus 93-53]KZT06787.1 hypothetical protein LAESUDRAFT_725549 [Laetiporus sulphureus 93-53]
MVLRSTSLRSHFKLTQSPLLRAYTGRTNTNRRYAVVGTTTFVGEPPSPPTPPSSGASTATPSADLPAGFDAHVLSELRQRASAGSLVSLPRLIEQYVDRSGHVLKSSLPYESRPGEDRRVTFDVADTEGTDVQDSVAMIVHAVQQGEEHKVTYCSGFALAAPGMPDGQSVFVTCAHTLEQIRHSPLLHAPSSSPTLAYSGSFVITGPSSSPTFTPVSSILSSVQRSDMLLLSTDSATAPLRTLPVSLYPAHAGTPVRAHFVRDTLPAQDEEGWRPWIGGTWSKWVRGSIVGYRDLAGREAKPGTYDALSHLLFDPPPLPGSSGGPIIDEESGAVIGVMLGTQMQNRLEGVRGWGVPSEIIFEMFSLPGLKLKNSS